MRVILVLFLSFVTHFSFAQADKSKRASPPDSVVVTTTDGVSIRVDYSRPSLKGREIGVDIVPVGSVWRTGANEATTVEVSKDVMWNGNLLKAGKYSLYTIPGERSTTMILNKDWKQWGAKYDAEKDALRFEAATGYSTVFQEKFKIDVTDSGEFSLNWGAFQVQSQIKAK